MATDLSLGGAAVAVAGSPALAAPVISLELVGTAALMDVGSLPNSTLADCGVHAVIIINGTHRLEVTANPPRVVKLLLPRMPRVGVAQVASAETSQADRATWRWWLADDPFRVLGVGPIFIPALNLESTVVVCECTPVAGEVLGRPTIATLPALLGPLSPRPWIQRPMVPAAPARGGLSARWDPRADGAGADATGALRRKRQRIRVLSYNVLADMYATTVHAREVLYPYCEPAVLHRGFREQLLTAELVQYDADLICLQEVDSSLYTRLLLPLLGAHGYDGMLDRKDGKGAEGCALFWRTAVLELNYNRRVVLSAAADDHAHSDLFQFDPSGDSAAAMERLGTIGQIARFNVVSDRARDQLGCQLVVVNTHLFYHPAAPHLRNIQTAVLLREAASVIDSGRTAAAVTGQQPIGLLFVGDLNSTPETGVVEFLCTGVLKSTHPEWRHGLRYGCGDVKNDPAAIPDTVAVEPITPAGQRRGNLAATWAADPFGSVPVTANANGGPMGDLTHQFRLVSGYPVAEMVAHSTNYTGGFAGWLDYIFCGNGVTPIARLPPIPEDVLASDAALPSPRFPSDHVPVAVDCLLP